jgi:hypothetical protein
MPFQAMIARRQLPTFAALLVTHRVRLQVALPLIVACVLVIAFIPWFASRGKFHIPGYGGIAILGFACGMLFGRMSGARSIVGTVAGFSLAVMFFLLMATAVGCLLALFFYRFPLED